MTTSSFCCKWKTKSASFGAITFLLDSRNSRRLLALNYFPQQILCHSLINLMDGKYYGSYGQLAVSGFIPEQIFLKQNFQLIIRKVNFYGIVCKTFFFSLTSYEDGWDNLSWRESHHFEASSFRILELISFCFPSYVP